MSTTISQSTGSTVYTITPSGTTCSGSVDVPGINSFSANPSSITAGQSSVLSWTVTNASSTTLDNGVGNVASETSTTVSPSHTTTYTLTATNGSGSSTTGTVTVSVTAASSGGGRGDSVGVASQYGLPFTLGAAPVSTSIQTGATTVTTSSTANLQTQLNSLLVLLNNLLAQAKVRGITVGVPISPNVFDKNLYPGQRGPEITELQQFLAENPAIYPQGKVTGYFGTLTTEAVQRFQKKYSIVSSGTPYTTGFGDVGPKTRGKLNSLFEADLTP